MATVLICGGDSWANRGDNAILAGTLEILREALPEAEIIVASDQPQITARDHGVRAVRRRSLSFLWAIWRSQLVLWGGGQLLQNASSKVFLLLQLSIVLLAKILGKKVMGFAQGIGPANGALDRLFCRLIINHLDLITVRDEASREELEALGITSPPTYITSDPALALSPASPQRGQKILTREGVKTPFVAMTVRRWGHYRGGWLPVRFVVNRRLWPPGHEAWFETFKTNLALLGDHIIEKLGAQVLFVPMCPGGDQEDDLVSYDILNKMTHQEHARILHGDYSPEELMALLGRAELVVGMRTHSLIMAAGMGVPVVSVSYQGKGESFLKAIGQEEYALPVETVSFPALKEIVDKAWAAREKIRGEITTKVKKSKTEARRNGELAKSILAHSCPGFAQRQEPFPLAQRELSTKESPLKPSQELEELRGSISGFDGEAHLWEGTYSRLSPKIALLPDLFRKTLIDRRRLCLNLSGIKKGQRVLDLGCGPGAYAREVLKAGGAWIGLDISAGMIAQAKEQLAQEGAKRGELALGEARRLPLADASVDTIICAGLLDYVPPAGLLYVSREMARVLKEGGCLVVTSNLYDPSRWLRSRLPPWVPRPIRVAGPAHFHSKAMPFTLTAAGFQIVQRLVYRTYFFQRSTLLLKCLKRTQQPHSFVRINRNHMDNKGMDTEKTAPMGRSTHYQALPGETHPPKVLARILPVVGVVVAGYVLLVAAFLSRHGWDIATLAHTSQQAEEGRVPQRYDGGAYYTMATDPFPLRKTPDIDSVRLRYSRPLYPFLAGGLALGNGEWIPYTLLGINLLAVGLATGLLAKALLEAGYSPWWALSYGLHPGTVFSVLLDLSEPLLYALVLLAMEAIKREKWSMGTLFFSLALLTKEEAAIFLVGVGLYLVTLKEWKRAGMVAMAFLPWGILTALLHISFPEETTTLGFPGSPFGFLEPPFLGYYEAAKTGFNTDMAITFSVTLALVLGATLIAVKRLLAVGSDLYPLILLISALFLTMLHFSTVMWPSSLLRFHMPLGLGLMLLGAHHKIGRLVRYSPLWGALTGIYLGHFLK